MRSPVTSLRHFAKTCFDYGQNPPRMDRRRQRILNPARAECASGRWKRVSYWRSIACGRVEYPGV
jgi:hypothetical protein